MGRLVEPRPDPKAVRAAGAGEPQDDGYLGRVAKYVPAEVVAAYLAINGIVTQPDTAAEAWVPYMNIAIFVLGLVVIPLYLTKQAKPGQPKRMHIVVSMIAFLVWSYAVEGAVYTNNVFGLNVHHAAIGSILIIVFSLISGALQPKEGDP